MKCKYFELCGDIFHYTTSCSTKYVFSPSGDIKGKCPICGKKIKVVHHIDNPSRDTLFSRGNNETD